MKQFISCLVVLLFFLSALSPLSCAAVPASGVLSKTKMPQVIYNDQPAGSRDISSRPLLDNTSWGGSWSEYFTQKSTDSDNRTRAIDGKLQLDTDFTSLTKWVNNPRILPSVGKFDSSNTRMVSMLYENGTFKAWYGGYDGTNWRIGYATSMDGINWTKQNSGNPVLNLGAGGTCDDTHVALPFIMNDGGTYKMWYGAHDGVNWQIAYATSSDGVSWTKYANNPVMNVKAGTFYNVQIYPGTVIKENGKYKMWLGGNNGNGNAGSRIGYATSNDGKAWNINANPVLPVGAGGSFDSTSSTSATVWWASSRYFMTYSGYDGVNMQIGAAESLDGIKWKKMNNNNPIIKKGAGGSWDSTALIETSRVQLGYRTYFLYGASGTSWQIGAALADNYFTEGYAYSQKIDLPNGMVWDNVTLKKAEPTGTSIKISVVDPSTNKSLTGFDNKTASDLNLSSIDSSAHKSLRLIAYFSGTTSKTPSLYMWGVSWRNATTWRDTFLGSNKISSTDLSKVRLWNDKIILDVDPLTWTKDASNPVLANGTLAQWDSIRVWDPSFLSKDGTNYLYYTGGTAPTEKIGYATAADLKTFTKYASNPVLSPSVGKFDSMGVRDPDLQYTDSTLKMYYGGRGTSTGINFAESTNMNTWTKYPAGPGFIPSAAGWDKGQVRDPSVMRVNNTWYMWYAANSTVFEMWRIGVAQSNDNGFFWTRPANNEVMDVGAGNKFDDMALESPSVIFDKDRYLMYYAGTDVSFGTGKIGVASSTDGLTWTRMNNGNAVVSPGSGWDASHIESVYVALVNGNYEMFYTASGAGGNLQIGHATAARYTSSTVISSTIELPGNGLWNGVRINKTEPSGTHVNVSVLNATTGSPIAGFADLTGTAIDISTLGVGTKIKLKATFEGDGKATPTLYDWAVNWTIAKVVQQTQIPDKSFLEEGTATNLYDLSQYFTHKLFSNKTLNYTIRSNSDAVNIIAKIESDGYHMSFSAPTVNWTGGVQYTINVTDRYTNLTSNQFTVSVLNVNDAPVWLKIPDKHIVEDTPVNNLVDLTKFVVDSDTLVKDLSFSIINQDPANMTIILDATQNINVSTVLNFTGAVNVTATVSDGQYAAETVFKIIVDAVNDRPVWTPFGPIQLVEDISQVDMVNLETLVKDAETPQSDLIYTVTDVPLMVAAKISTDHKLSLYPAANYTGSTNLTFYVSDSVNLVPLVVAVNVIAVNDRPLWFNFSQYTIQEDSRGDDLVSLENFVVDAETLSKDLIFNVENVSEPSASVMIDANHRLDVVPAENYFGTMMIEISASDGMLTAMTNITVLVTPVNDPPIITSTPITKAKATELYQYQVVAMDIENDHLTFSLTSSISGMTIDASTGLISWTPSESQSGSYEVKLKVSDGAASSLQDYFLDVSPKASGSNNPPVITSEAPTDTTVGERYTYAVLATDADKDPLTYSLSTRPTGMTVTSLGGAVDWTPQPGMEGVHPVIVAVSDGKAVVTQSFQVTVYPKGTVINHPPVITSSPNVKTLLGSEYTYNVVATDADADVLQYYLSLSPQNMTIDQTTGHIKWTPSSGDLGEQRIIVRVSDGKANVSQAFTLQVSFANHLPSITSTPITKATVGKQYEYQLAASDLDTSDKLLFGLRSGPVGMSVDPSTGLVRWTPSKSGTETVTVYVTDGIVQTNQTFDIKVTTKTTTGLDLANFPWWIIVVLVAAVGAILAVILSRRRSKVEEPEALSLPVPAKETQLAKPVHKVSRQRPVVPSKATEAPVEKAPVPAPSSFKVAEVVDIDDMEDEPEVPNKVDPAQKDPLVKKDAKETKVVKDGPTARTEETGRPKPTSSKDERSTNDILEDLLGKAGK